LGLWGYYKLQGDIGFKWVSVLKMGSRWALILKWALIGLFKMALTKLDLGLDLDLGLGLHWLLGLGLNYFFVVSLMGLGFL
jgi:hypothetical protein